MSSDSLEVIKTEIEIAEQELHTISGPIDPSKQFDTEANSSDENLNTIWELLSTTSKMDLSGNMEIRRDECLQFAALHFNRKFGKDEDIDPAVDFLTRSTRKKYKDILSVLYLALCAKRFQFADESYGYQPSGHYGKLLKIIDQFNMKLRKAGVKEIPKTPVWGDSLQDHIRFWDINDYEIFSVLFRYDTERYIKELNVFLTANLEVKPKYITFNAEGRDSPPHLKEESVVKIEDTADQQPEKQYTAGEKKGILALQQFGRYDPNKDLHTSLKDLGYHLEGDRLLNVGRFSVIMQESFDEENDDDSDDEEEEEKKPELIKKPLKIGSNPPDDPDSSDSDSSLPPPPRSKKTSSKTPDPERSRSLSKAPQSMKEAYFDLRLKPDSIPEWNGNPDSLAQWVIKLNSLAKRSTVVFTQLGQLIPTRLKDEAEDWYYSLPSEHREKAEINWETMRKAIGSYYMNRSWLDKQKIRAREAYYRDHANPRESPSAYYIRKAQLLTLVNNLSDSEIIMEVMNSAPTGWTSILTTHLYNTVVEFQAALKYHEDMLIRISEDEKLRKREYIPNFLRGQSTSRESSKGYFGKNQPKAKTYLVGQSNNLGPPTYPKDDSTRAKGKTPQEAGARPCRHCGSGMHWDNECKYAQKSARKAKANLAVHSEEHYQAQEEYEDLFFSTLSDDTSESENEQGSNPQDF